MIGGSAKRQHESPSVLDVLALLCLSHHTPERLVSRVPWNKSPSFVLRIHPKKDADTPIACDFNRADLFIKEKAPIFIRTRSYGGVEEYFDFVM